MLTRTNGSTTVLTVSGSEAHTAVLGVTKVRIATTTNIYVAIGAAAAASSSGCLILPAGQVETFSIAVTDRVSVIQVSAGGVASVTPIR